MISVRKQLRTREKVVEGKIKMMLYNMPRSSFEKSSPSALPLVHLSGTSAVNNMFSSSSSTPKHPHSSGVAVVAGIPDSGKFILNVYNSGNHNIIQTAAAAAMRRGDRYSAIADDVEDVVEEPGNSSDEAPCDSPRVHLSVDSNVAAQKAQSKESRLSVESWGAAVEVEAADDDAEELDDAAEEGGDELPGESPSDVEEEIGALEIQSDDSSAADDSDVECSFYNNNKDVDAENDDHNDHDEDEYCSPARDRNADDCPLMEMRDILDETDEHPFLCIEDQAAMIASHRSQTLYDFCSSMTNQSALGSEELSISAKILLNEAHRQQKRRHASLIPAVRLGGMHLLPSHLRSVPSNSSMFSNPDQRRVMWERVANHVARDLYVEGHSFVQRRLSCMCIFSVTRDERLYHDNDSERMQRLARQERLLAEIQEQAMQGGSRYFLDLPASS